MTPGSQNVNLRSHQELRSWPSLTFSALIRRAADAFFSGVVEVAWNFGSATKLLASSATVNPQLPISLWVGRTLLSVYVMSAWSAQTTISFESGTSSFDSNEVPGNIRNPAAESKPASLRESFRVYLFGFRQCITNNIRIARRFRDPAHAEIASFQPVRWTCSADIYARLPIRLESQALKDCTSVPA